MALPLVLQGYFQITLKHATSIQAFASDVLFVESEKMNDICCIVTLILLHGICILQKKPSNEEHDVTDILLFRLHCDALEIIEDVRKRAENVLTIVMFMIVTCQFRNSITIFNCPDNSQIKEENIMISYFIFRKPFNLILLFQFLQIDTLH